MLEVGSIAKLKGVLVFGDFSSSLKNVQNGKFRSSATEPRTKDAQMCKAGEDGARE